VFEFVREEVSKGFPLTPLRIALCIINSIVHGRVFSGPFARMEYVEKSIGSAHYPKLLGTYEMELVPIIERLCAKSFKRIVNVGAGEGYYAVGFLIRCPSTEVIAYEASSNGCKLIKELAERNRVQDRLAIFGLCDVGRFAAIMADNDSSLVIMDVEGAESVLLDPTIAPNLKRSHILVELHEVFVPGVGEAIKKRFSSTHTITEIRTRKRTMLDFPIKLPWITRVMLKRYFLEAMFENRKGQMIFFYLQPKD